MSASLQKHYRLSPSRNLSVFILLGLILISLSFLNWSISFQWLILIDLFSVFFCGFIFFRDARLSLGISCVAFRLEEHSAVTMMLRDGTHRSGKTMSSSVILSSLILLNIRQDDGRLRSLILLKDCMSGHSFRHLRVALRWEG